MGDAIAQLDEDAFREEVRGFIRDHYPAAMRVRAPYEDLDKEQQLLWHRTLYRKGWVAPHWPVEYGGTGWSIVQQHVWEQELAAADTLPLLAFSLTMVGPVIYTYGTDEQKRRFLPSILSGDHWWCQGYSEPGAGSDLANVRTRAVRDGDHYIVNGHKTWTTLAQHAYWIFALVRTNPDARAQQGISFLLIDMTSPGVSVRPIITLDGAHEVNDVFFDNVKVPVENRIGEEDRGWTYAKFLLGNERTSMAGTARSRAALDQLKRVAAVHPEGAPLLAHPDFARQVARADIALRALEATERAVLEAAANGREPGFEASLFKIRGTEIYQDITRLATEAAGRYALVNHADRGGRDAPHPGPAESLVAMQEWLNARKKTIYGGSNEIQRNIIAKQVLGL